MQSKNISQPQNSLKYSGKIDIPNKHKTTQSHDFNKTSWG